VVKSIHMHLRGVKTIVRAHNVTDIRLCWESLIQRWMKIDLPEQIMTGVVVADDGVLSKHLLGPNDVGTIGWAIKEIGPSALRDKVLKSAGDVNAPAVISVKDLLD